MLACMNRSSALLVPLLLSAALLGPTPVARSQAAAAPPASAPAPTLREPVAQALVAAEALIKEGKGREALAKVDEAERVGGLSPLEAMYAQRTRALAAQAAGDNALVLKSLEAALATGAFPEADRVRTLELMVSLASRQKDPAAVLRHSQAYLQAGGGSDAVRLMRIQAMADSGDQKGAAAALRERHAALEKAGARPPEGELRYLLSLQRGTQDPAAAAATLERLAALYPRTEYWGEVVGGAIRRAPDDDRVLIELYRLLRAVGVPMTAALREAYADIALRLGLPGEASVLLEEGFAAGQLGTGERASEHRRMREQAAKGARTDAGDRQNAESAARASDSGNGLVDLAFSIFTSLPVPAPRADAAAAVTLMEQGIAKGKLRRESAARLHLGMMQLAAGRKDDAKAGLASLAASAGGDPLAEPARLWAMWAAAPPMLPPR
jgi:hypothetical protein